MGVTLGVLILMQWFIIWECIKMKGHVTSHSTDLQTSMGDMGSLLDEALDFLAENVPSPSTPNPVFAQTGTDMKEMLLTAFMSKMMMPSEHGPQQEERKILQDEETNE